VSVPLLDLPAPPEGTWWCSECATLYAGAVQARCAAELDKIRRDGKTGTVRMMPALDGLPMLEPAIAWGGGTFLQILGVTPLCWSHLGALKTGGVRPASQLGNRGPG